MQLDLENMKIKEIQEEVDRQFALGREFYDLPLEEKLRFHDLEGLRRGEYNGFVSIFSLTF